MQVSVEATGGLERRMTVSVPAERIENEVENRLRKLASTAKLKGFRPGKVPRKVIDSHYGPQVRQEVVNEVTRSSFFEAINQENLQLAGMPRFQPRVTESGRDLEYEALFEVLAEIELAPMADAEIVRSVSEVTEQDIDTMLETLRGQRGTWQPVERAVREQDQVVIDFVGTIDGEEFEGNRGDRVTVMPGSGRFLQSFEMAVVGAAPGEERTVEVEFPADYHVANVAGKKAEFRITVHSVSELQLPAVDEAFIRSFDVPEGTMDAMRSELRRTMEDEMADAIRDRLRKQALDALYEANKAIDVPRTQVEGQIDALLAQAQEMLQRQGVPAGEIKLERSTFEDQARRRVVLGMLVREVVSKQGFSADPQKVRQRVEAIAESYENTDEAIRWYYGDRNRLANVEQLVLEDQVVDWVVSQARVREESTAFEVLLKERRGR